MKYLIFVFVHPPNSVHSLWNLGCSFIFCSTSQFAIATFQELDSHMCLVTIGSKVALLVGVPPRFKERKYKSHLSMKEGAKIFFKMWEQKYCGDLLQVPLVYSPCFMVKTFSNACLLKPKPLEFGCKVCVWGQTYLLVDFTEGWLTGAGHLTGDVSQISIFDCPS